MAISYGKADLDASGSFIFSITCDISADSKKYIGAACKTKVTRENYLFDTETNQYFVFGTRKFELSYLESS